MGVDRGISFSWVTGGGAAGVAARRGMLRGAVVARRRAGRRALARRVLHETCRRGRRRLRPRCGGLGCVVEGCGPRVVGRGDAGEPVELGADAGASEGA